MSHWAVFLDRDGVINEPVPHPVSGLLESPHRAEDVELTPGCVEALGMLRGTGAALVVVSNQPSAAKGTATDADLDAVHREIAGRLAAAGVAPDDWRYCRHHPDALDPARAACDCRKPAPGDAPRGRARPRSSISPPRGWWATATPTSAPAGRPDAARSSSSTRAPRTGVGAEDPDVSVPTILDAARHWWRALGTPGPHALEGAR